MLQSLYFELGLHRFGIIVPILAVLLPFIILILIKVPYNAQNPIKWQHVIENFNYSNVNFYSSVKIRIQKHQIPRLMAQSTVLKRDGHLFSTRRRFLRIGRKNIRVYVSTMQFGTSQVFSSWTVPKISLLRWMYLKIPIIGPMLGNMYMNMTFYKQDAHFATFSLVHTCVLDEIDAITAETAARKPEGDERKPLMYDMYRR